MKALLEMKDIADELQTKEVNIRRLVARGRLAAAQLGDQKRFRITRQALDDYVRAGAPDFEMPHHDAQWFFDTVKRMEVFESQFAAAIATTPASDATLKAALKKEFKGEQAEQFTLDVAINPAMRKVIESPVPWPTGVFARKDLGGASIDERIKDFREYYIIEWLRQKARIVMKMDLDSSLMRFYSTPDFYQETIAKAAQEVKQRVLFTKEQRTLTYELESPTVIGGKTVTTRQQNILVWYQIRLGQLFDAGHDKRLAELAF